MKKIILVSRCAWTLYNFRAGLIRKLVNEKHVVIGGGAGEPEFEAKIKELGIPFVVLPVDKQGINLWADFKLFWALHKWYRKEKPDIVHHFTIKPVIYGSLAARLAGVPRIVNTITGLGSVFINKKSWLRYLVEIQYRIALAAAHYTFFQNADDLNCFLKRRLIPQHKSGLLPGSGVDCSAFVPLSDHAYVADKPVAFLMVSRLLRDKGIYEYIGAARLVKKSFPEVRFNLLGRRDERNPSVVSQEELDGWQRERVVTWLGEIPDVRPVIMDADVVVLPSYREGVPKALLEAAAVGKPLIATDVAGCREVVEDLVNGLRVPVRDVERLAEAIIWMIRNPAARLQMGKEGRKKIEQNFDEKFVVEKILEIYNKEKL